ncbi:probable E3 ubiquitin-protein ligase ZFP1 isoform X2 [Prosopis cineraria]|nr:probable E3 ubiquitin-protein ligase ZFP1 isoform X2 [Prosopis cineraria]XP_054815179.1 probable E3 ubiquitin-protein ligase ZFP1 isoform X2 [Prosopis cineraria]
MTDLEMDRQRQDYYHSEPCLILRGPNISQPNIHTVVAASGNTSNIDSHYSLDAHENGLMYGMTQFNGIHHQPNFDARAAASSGLYFSATTPPSGAGVVPQPFNYRASDQLPAPGTYAFSGIFMDDARGPYKQKITEGIRGNYQHFNAAASSSVAPPNTRHSDGVTASFSLPQFRGNHIPSLVEIGPHGCLWSRSGDSVLVHEHNHLIRGNYLGQRFQPAPPPWLDQQLNGTNSEGHNMAWNQSHSMPYLQATVNGSSLENANTGMQRYHDTANNRSSLRFAHQPPVNQQHHNYHLPTLPMQGVRGHNINFHPPVTATTYRGVPSNSPHSTVIPVQNGFGLGGRHVDLVPSASQWIHRSHRGVTPDTSLRHQNSRPMSFLHVDDVALLDEVENLIDHHHGDMRLDIEDMSYEELLALGERIGNVSTGLSEETITTQLKTKTFDCSGAANLKEAASEDEENDSCIICLDEYKKLDTVGILECGHEYHADCLKKWLLLKNVCPICKSEALITPRTKGA